MFKAVGLKSFHQACDYVWRLPYGRTSEPYQFKTVLSESRGTCSSKHALLKLLADENGVEVELVVGLYPMKESNTPGVGVVLDKYGYKFIPEAHCYLNFRGSRVDLTRFGSEAVEEINEFFIEVPVRPQKLAKVKPEMHRQFLVEKYGEGQVASVWQIREECIAALST
ncbi:hypothetical protein ACQKE9_02125 [Shewanella vesiculosa]|uniref:hypothetical protein n=1 Tax=Shewanella vesiculosa TaxID=518738 RepID=UPI003D065457